MASYEVASNICQALVDGAATESGSGGGGGGGGGGGSTVDIDLRTHAMASPQFPGHEWELAANLHAVRIVYRARFVAELLVGRRHGSHIMFVLATLFKPSCVQFNDIVVIRQGVWLFTVGTY